MRMATPPKFLMPGLFYVYLKRLSPKCFHHLSRTMAARIDVENDINLDAEFSMVWLRSLELMECIVASALTRITLIR